MGAWPVHNPAEVVDYIVDWSDRLEDDTILTSTFTFVVQAGLVKGADSKTDTTATVPLSGGTAGLIATIRNTITTAGARTYESVETLVISGLTVEDGTGVVDAEAVSSLAWIDNHHAKRGNMDWFDGSVGDREAAVRRGTTNFSTAWTFKGVKTYGRLQGQAFPRTGCTDGEGNEIASDEIPVEAKVACAELALREKRNPGSTAPDVVLTERVKSERVGPISTEYVVGGLDAGASRPVYLLVQDIVGGLLSNSRSSLFGTAVRS